VSVINLYCSYSATCTSSTDPWNFRAFVVFRIKVSLNPWRILFDLFLQPAVVQMAVVKNLAPNSCKRIRYAEHTTRSLAFRRNRLPHHVNLRRIETAEFRAVGPARPGSARPRRTAIVQDRRQAIAVILADPARSGAWSTDRDVGKFPRGIIHHRPLSLEFRCCKLVATSVGRRRLWRLQRTAVFGHPRCRAGRPLPRLQI